ncbi:2008_t:CDS:1 [Diversispora eburnea]|uniref:2008_t:CDS:1 n=1 Tax=Diversispora eburnea TaxID=1213867 RepID=A0A9N9C1A7_9GLOM|nr:2008_t:CDS:1 [Diversispora eburnea]
MAKFKLTEKDKEIRDKTNIRGKIKEVTHFSNDNKNYAIVINKVYNLYAIRLINYDYEDSDEVKVKAIKRFPDLMNFYKTKEEVFEKAKEIPVNPKLINKCVYEFETHEDDVENNILLIGRTGSGKSTLANVISGSNDFKESEGSVSKTKNFQNEVFEHEGIKYRVIDTIGVGDTNLSHEKVIFKLAEAIYTMKRGIKQIFIVLGGRFTEEERELFVMAKKIFGREIIEHTTIVRNRFESFENSEKCDKDRKELSKENKEISNLINSCGGIVYVNNPPLSESEKRRKIDEEDRESSRKKLFEHLKSRSNETYRMENWDDMCVGINDYMNAKNLKESGENTNNPKIFAEARTKMEINNIKQEIIDEIKNQSLKSEDVEAHCFTKVNTFAFNVDFTFKLKNICSIQ